MWSGQYNSCWGCHLESPGFLGTVMGEVRRLVCGPRAAPGPEVQRGVERLQGRYCLVTVESINSLHETESSALHQGLWPAWKLSHVLLKPQSAATDLCTDLPVLQHGGSPSSSPPGSLWMEAPSDHLRAEPPFIIASVLESRGETGWADGRISADCFSSCLLCADFPATLLSSVMLWEVELFSWWVSDV